MFSVGFSLYARLAYVPVNDPRVSWPCGGQPVRRLVAKTDHKIHPWHPGSEIRRKLWAEDLASRFDWSQQISCQRVHRKRVPGSRAERSESFSLPAIENRRRDDTHR